MRRLILFVLCLMLANVSYAQVTKQSDTEFKKSIVVPLSSQKDEIIRVQRIIAGHQQVIVSLQAELAGLQKDYDDAINAGVVEVKP